MSRGPKAPALERTESERAELRRLLRRRNLAKPSPSASGSSSPAPSRARPTCAWTGSRRSARCRAPHPLPDAAGPGLAAHARLAPPWHAGPVHCARCQDGHGHLPLPVADHRPVNAMLGCRWRHHQLARSASSATSVWKSAEYRVRLPTIRVRPSHGQVELTRLPEIWGPPQGGRYGQPTLASRPVRKVRTTAQPWPEAEDVRERSCSCRSLDVPS